MHLKISHTTEYNYDQPVGYALQRLRLTPLSGRGQTVLHWNTEIEGGNVEVAYDDHYGNFVQMVSTHPGSDMIRVIASGEIDTEDRHGVAGPHIGFSPLWLYLRETRLTKPAKPIRDLARSVDNDEPLERLHALMARIAETVAYEIGTTDAETTAEEALEAGSGVCQDHAHIFLSAARYLDFPARYVSGYLMMNDRTEQVATHAWAEAHVEGLGWVGFDAANGISPDERYVRMATGLDYVDAAPISGIRLGNAAETLAVSITVEQ
ncbi:transglutaminase family protein [Pararhizobium haloflavum]|uniref:transglutaminase family protein n=1 Tax=Pararhizobium haloflavum TaxID=2037914 RepID=UPI000C18834E|nr:transglutaminase family protein [Pararhizobium haloflavum]